jgi:energy-coupling factor transport system ATP-binding protein
MSTCNSTPLGKPTVATTSGATGGACVRGVRGNNFSGRTACLRQFAGLPETLSTEWHINEPALSNAYVGPDSHNYISGLALTAMRELGIHGLETSPMRETVDGLTRSLGLDRLLHRNPFTLSGGEQAMLTVLSALALAPRRLSLDCTLEQLSQFARETIIRSLKTCAHQGVDTLIADNRMQEYGHLLATDGIDVLAQSQVARTDPAYTAALRFVELPYRTSPCTLSLEGITFWYEKGQPVLQDLSYHFEPGRVYHLTGKNGAGKSTLSKLMCGILKPRSGTMTKNQREAIRPWKEPAKYVAYHFQNPDLQLFSLTVREELAQSSTNDQQEPGWLDAVAEPFGLQSVLDRHPLDLPFVMRKRVAMAASVAMRRPWLILDEPTLGQDDQNACILAKQLTYLASQGVGVIVISHSEWFQKMLPGQHLTLTNGALRTQ